MALGRIIQNAREDLGLSRSDLAGLIETDRQVIWNWEEGVHQPAPHNLERLNKVLGVDLIPHLEERRQGPEPSSRGVAGSGEMHPLAAERLRRGMSQEELGELLGVSRTWVYKIEHGHRAPSRKLARRIMDKLGIVVSRPVKIRLSERVYALAHEQAQSAGVTLEDWITEAAEEGILSDSVDL